MKKVRLKDGVSLVKINAPYGTVTHDWTLVPDAAHVYTEMEVFGEIKPKIEPVKAVEPEFVPEKPIVVPVVESKPIKSEPKVVLKKKGKYR